MDENNIGKRNSNEVTGRIPPAKTATLMEHLEYDLGTAAFLTAKGLRLLGLADAGRGRYAFRFADGEAAAQAALDYMQGEAVPAKALIAAEKDLKTLLYSTKGSRNGNGNYGRNT